MKKVFSEVLNLKNLGDNPSNRFILNDFSFKLIHLENDPDNANRLFVSQGSLDIELLPSKGFSVGQVKIDGNPIFWEAPIQLPDTEVLDLWSDEIRINGEPSKGFTFLKTFTGGIELYGLKNWGMPVVKDNELYPLHGETSNIPVDEVTISVSENNCSLEAGFIYRSFKGDSQKPWYLRGEELFKVSRKITLERNSPSIILEDSIENISQISQSPDWGYHITFMPLDGTRLVVPSKNVMERSGASLPADIETWHTAENPEIRTEVGIIHKDLMLSKESSSAGEASIFVIYPNNKGLRVAFPPSPYFQTWFCSGGKGSKEFTDANGNSLLQRNWDGIGIEIGSSALDHNGNIDASVAYTPVLKPYEIKRIKIKIEMIGKEEITDFINDFF